MNNILLKKLQASTVKLSELDQHIELEEFLTDLVESWATDCEIKNISQEDYDYLVNLLARFGEAIRTSAVMIEQAISRG